MGTGIPFRDALQPGSQLSMTRTNPGDGVSSSTEIRSGDGRSYSIAGSGPSLFAWVSSSEQAELVRTAGCRAFADHDLSAEGWIAPLPGDGAQLLESP